MNRNSEITKLPLDPFYGTPEAAAYFGYSVSHFRALVRAGKLPQPVRIAGRKLGWRASLLSEFATAAEIEQQVRPSSSAA
jgi:predicted DNA-binding transcriptional regulator AlpA